MVGHRNRNSWHDTNPHGGSGNDEVWTGKAECRNVKHPEFFTGELNRMIDPERKVTAEMLAKEVCRRCIVTSECLNHALTTGEDDGIWGGLNPTERRKLRLIPKSLRGQ